MGAACTGLDGWLKILRPIAAAPQQPDPPVGRPIDGRRAKPATGITLNKQPPRLAVVASEMGHERTFTRPARKHERQERFVGSRTCLARTDVMADC
jgi:hypothetical protein